MTTASNPRAKALEPADFLQKIAVPYGWTVDDSTSFPGCVVLRHQTYGATTIDTQRRLYAVGSGTPKPATCTMTYKGKSWEQRIVNEATAHNAGFWHAA